MIDGTIAGELPQLDEVDFKKIDLILDAAEVALLAVAAKHHLRAIKIERWRWDKPEILMSWSPLRDVPLAGKNIRVNVKPERIDSYLCAFESNAWYDVRWDANSFNRYWAHFPAGQMTVTSPEESLSAKSGRILEHVETAYERVSDSAEVTLHKAIHISSDGDSQRVHGAVVIGAGVARFVDQAASAQR